MDCQVSILIVDRNSGSREALRDLLDVEGYSVCDAASGCEAQLFLRGFSRPPCIVLLGQMSNLSTGEIALETLAQEQYLLDIAMKVLCGNVEIEAEEPEIEIVDAVEEEESAAELLVGAPVFQKVGSHPGLAYTRPANSNHAVASV